MVELTSTCAERRERWLTEEDIRSRSYQSECGFFKYRASLAPRLSGWGARLHTCLILKAIHIKVGWVRSVRLDFSGMFGTL